MRRFFINKVENMRDIGGYSIDNFKIVKEGKLLRSNCVTNLTNEDIKQLTEIAGALICNGWNYEEIEGFLNKIAA